MVRGAWTKKMFVIGAVPDGLLAVVMLAPSLEAFAWGFNEPVLDSGYRFAMRFGAELMVGWTALLAWALSAVQMVLLIGLALAFRAQAATGRWRR